MKQITVNNEVAYKIKNYTGYYITKTGIIYSVKALGKNGMIDYTNPHKLKYKKDRYGYFKVFLSNDGIAKEYSVHKLVTLQFIGRIPKNKQVNHIDGDKLNNNVTNLEIVTPKENTIHAHKNHLTSTECPVNVIYENKEYKFNSKIECMNYFKDISRHYLKQLQENIIIPSMILFERTYDENNKQKIKTYYNGQFLKEFSMMKDAEIYFNMKKGTVSAIIKLDNQEYRRKINKYIISFTNVSTIENTSIDGSK